MITVSTVFDFERQYCAYYRVLEDDFVATEKYLTVNPDNYSAYSNEFIKLLQSTCSELDVALKYMCNLIDPKFKGTTFPEYCKCILNRNPHFVRATVSLVRVQTIMLAPWMGWSYTEKTSKKGKKYVESINPEWWTMYNKIKHDRTATCPDSKKPYYKYANQENTLNALAALYVVLSCVMNEFCLHIESKDSAHFLTEWYKSSRLFTGFLIARNNVIPQK